MNIDEETIQGMIVCIQDEVGDKVLAAAVHDISEDELTEFLEGNPHVRRELDIAENKFKASLIHTASEFAAKNASLMKFLLEAKCGLSTYAGKFAAQRMASEEADIDYDAVTEGDF